MSYKLKQIHISSGGHGYIFVRLVKHEGDLLFLEPLGASFLIEEVTVAPANILSLHD